MLAHLETIDDALDAIYSFVDYSMTHAEEISSAVFSLNRITELLNRLNNPQEAYRCIHIAGTKGKGSVCTMIYEGLRASGYKTGLYTSPHLIHFNERIQVDGKMISDAELIQLTEKVIEKIDPANPPSSFDMMTAIAFEYFREQKVEYAVVETGLGGRLDSTNVVHPVLTVITSISMDHMNFLGDTIEKIATEKGGIIKRNVPLIAAAQDPKAMDVIRKIAEERNAEWIDVDQNYGFVPLKDSVDGQRLMIWERKEQNALRNWLENREKSIWKPWEVDIPLAGYHQSINAVIAFTALMKIRSFADKINEKSISDGLAKTFWPCRFEKVSIDPPVILDGAHNPDSIEKLVMTLNRFYGTKRITCVFGCSEDKDLSGMIRILAPFVSDFIVTRSTHPRSMETKQIYDEVLSNGRPAVIRESLELALRDIDSGDKNNVYIVTGSLFVTAGIRELLMKRNPDMKYFEKKK